MTDVRSLLRSELASRRGTPQTGTTTPNRVTKKRKVDPSDSITRKRVKQTNPDQLLANPNAQIRPPSAQLIAEDEDDVEPEPQDIMRTESDIPAEPETVEETVVETTTKPLETPIPPSEVQAQPQPQTQNIDEDEWAAFEREVAAPSRAPQRPAALAAAATISAAPVTTEELAALQEKENEAHKQNREIEAEGEREDAARSLEEEFDEMEQLEERVRRLKSMREQLRAKRATESAERDEAATARPATAEPPKTSGTTAAADEEDDEEDDDDDADDDADDDWDNWRFR